MLTLHCCVYRELLSNKHSIRSPYLISINSPYLISREIISNLVSVRRQNAERYGSACRNEGEIHDTEQYFINLFCKIYNTLTGEKDEQGFAYTNMEKAQYQSEHKSFDKSS